MSRDDWPNTPPPRRRRRPWSPGDDASWDRDRHGRPGTPGAVVAVAVVDFVLGGLVMVFSFCCSPFLLFMGDFVLPLNQLGFPSGRSGTILFIGCLVAVLFWGISNIVAGIGIINLLNWGRIFALIVGGFGAMAGSLAVIFGVLILTSDRGDLGERLGPALGFLVPGAVFLGHAAWSYILLLHPRYVKEFS